MPENWQGPHLEKARASYFARMRARMMRRWQKTGEYDKLQEQSLSLMRSMQSLDTISSVVTEESSKTPISVRSAPTSATTSADPAPVPLSERVRIQLSNRFLELMSTEAELENALAEVSSASTEDLSIDIFGPPDACAERMREDFLVQREVTHALNCGAPPPQRPVNPEAQLVHNMSVQHNRRQTRKRKNPKNRVRDDLAQNGLASDEEETKPRKDLDMGVIHKPRVPIWHRPRNWPVDKDLYYALAEEAMFLPRKESLWRHLKLKTKQILSEYDLSHYSREELYAMKVKTIAAAMMPSIEEVEALDRLLQAKIVDVMDWYNTSITLVKEPFLKRLRHVYRRIRRNVVDRGPSYLQSVSEALLETVKVAIT